MTLDFRLIFVKISAVVRRAMGRGEKIKVALVCPACGQSGTAWMDDDAASGAYSPDHLTPLSDQFYFRMPRSFVGPLEVVCAKCGAILD